MHGTVEAPSRDLRVCARHGALLEGESPLHTRQREVLAKGKGVVARRGLKEAHSKALARRTETAYEAAVPDKVARHTEVQYLSTGIDVNAAGISVKVVCLTRGDLTSCLVLPTSRGVGMWCEKSAEGIVGGVTSRRDMPCPGNVREPERLTTTEGLNPKLRTRSCVVRVALRAV